MIFFPQILQIFYKFKLTYLVFFLSGDSTANQFGGKKRMFWLNLLFEYISTFFLQFTAALVWGFSFSHSSLGPLKASLPAAPPHSPAWRWLRTHTYLPPLSVFPLEKKGIIKFCLSAVSIIFLKPAAVRWQLEEVTYGLWAPLLTGNDSPPYTFERSLNLFGGLRTNKATLCVALDYQYHRKRIFPRVSVLLCWWGVFPESTAACVGWFWGLMKRRNSLSEKLA